MLRTKSIYICNELSNETIVIILTNDLETLYFLNTKRKLETQRYTYRSHSVPFKFTFYVNTALDLMQLQINRENMFVKLIYGNQKNKLQL